MSSVIENHPDEQRIVDSLASECRVPVSEIATLYAKERATLAQGAHLTEYLPIFATRNVREIIRTRGLSKAVAPMLEAAGGHAHGSGAIVL